MSVIDEHFDENILFEDSFNDASEGSSFNTRKSSTIQTPLAYTSHVTQFNADAIGEIGEVDQTVPSDCKFRLKDLES